MKGEACRVSGQNKYILPDKEPNQRPGFLEAMPSLGKIALLRLSQGNSPLGWRQRWGQRFSYSKINHQS